MSRRAFVKSAGILTSGNIAAQVMGFARNAIVARFLPVEDFGVAATFVITISMLDMLTDLGTERLLIQSKEGDDERFQRSLQFVHFLIGLFKGAVIFLAAGALAGLFNAPEAGWAFQWLALIPVIRALGHLDKNRVQRQMRFGPQTGIDVASQGAALALAFPIAGALRDYTAVLWLSMGQVVVAVVLSHLIAKRVYRWAIEPEHLRQALRFGWPLLINGALLAAIMLGDRFLIAAQYTKEQLAFYSAAAMLVMVPTGIVANISRSLFLPPMSRAQDDPREFARRASIAIEGLGFISACAIVGFSMMGALVASLVYGAPYAVAGPFVAILGAAQALRMLRIAPNIAAMARGDTQNPMWSNVARAAILPLAVVFAMQQRNPLWIAFVSLGGELIAIVCATILLQTRQRAGLGAALRVLALSVLATGYALIAHRLVPEDAGALVLIGATTAGLAFIAIVSIGLLPDTRREAFSRAPTPGAGTLVA